MSKSVETPEVVEFVSPDAETIGKRALEYIQCFETPADALHALVENVSEKDRQLALFRRVRHHAWADKDRSNGNAEELVHDTNADALYVAGVRITIRAVDTEKGKRYTRSALRNPLYDANGTFTLGRELKPNAPCQEDDAVRYALMSFGTHFENVIDMREQVLTPDAVKVETVALDEYNALQAERDELMAKLKAAGLA